MCLPSGEISKDLKYSDEIEAGQDFFLFVRQSHRKSTLAGDIVDRLPCQSPLQVALGGIIISQLDELAAVHVRNPNVLAVDVSHLISAANHWSGWGCRLAVAVSVVAGRLLR